MSQKERNTKEKEKPTRKLTRVMRRRTVAFLAAVLVMLSGLSVRLFQLQVLEHDYWQQQAVAQQLNDIEIPANRGQIYDSNMSVLALTREVFDIAMTPKNINQETTRVKIADELSVMLDIDRDELYEKTTNKQSSYALVKSKVDKEQSDIFSAWVTENKLGSVFHLVSNYKREYPLNNLLSTVIGFVGVDNEAREGLEKEYDEVLSGVPGRMVIAQNTSGDQLPTSSDYEYTVAAQDGNSLVLTIDQYIQQVTEKYLSETLEQYGATNRGCAIVMDPDTCAILAMATKGDYDPNNYLQIADPDVAAQVALLSGDEQAEAVVNARMEQYRNKALDFYEPGSVFKTFTASMGLEEGLVSEESAFYCSGYYTIADRIMRCWVYPNNHGQQTFRTAFANSCNPSFMTLGGKIGATIFSKYYTGFGFTERTGVDMLGEQSVSNKLYYQADSMTPVNVAASSIGQTFKVTPIQMATALCAVANGGYLMEPYVVQQILDSDGNVIENHEPVVRRQVISESTSERVCALLGNAVSSGAIKNAYIAGYRVGGKTGTAQKTETREDDQPAKDQAEVVASFAGIAPSEDPEVVVLVMIDEPQTLKSGGGVAAPAAKKILRDILPYLGVEPNYTAEEIAGLDRSVPQVTGNKVSVAATTLGNASLSYYTVGKGDTVVRQVPESGTSIPKNGTVWLYTDESETQMATVPDFTGRNVAQVNQAAQAAGINVLLSGISTTGGAASASQQSATPGQKVPKGTVITVEFSYADRIF